MSSPRAHAAPIRLAYSPDADDAFMFWALRDGKIDPRGLCFEYTTADTEVLNRGAEDAGAPDVTAVSLHQYAYLADRYLLLPHGASVGAGYGPIVVAARPMRAEELSGTRIGVPGLRTTAYLVLRLVVPRFDAVVVPVSPFRRAYQMIAGGDVDAAVLIHEGRLLYEREGLYPVLELGEAWQTLTGLPLPLGVNVIRRALGPERVALVSAVLRESIRWALDHREEVLSGLVVRETREGVPRERTLFDRYLAMYANQDTLELGSGARRGVEELFRRGHAAGVIPHAVRVAFAP